MTYPRSREGAAQVTVPLEDLALTDRESVFYAPRAGDVALLGVLVAVLLGNGAWIWRQLGGDSHAGRAVFFGMLLLCVYWCAVVYTLKLSLSVRVNPRSIAVARGPWQVEIRWSELTRLMERMQTVDRRRYRWVIALARDGRRISIREDAIGDYARFRREAYERYRLWRDHGGTWGATGSGPFAAREVVRDEARWWAVAALMIALPGLYFMLLLPETNPLGYLLLAGTVACLIMLARAFLLRQTYTIERQYIEARSALKRSRLTWNEITKVERSRHPVSGVILSGVALGRLALRLASRGDAGIRSFAWSPRVPEYLTLRGGGRQTRIRLHHLMQPDELLAWVEFYDQVRRSSGPLRARATSAPLAGAHTGPTHGPTPARATSGPMSGPISAPMPTPDLSGASGPLDPWGAGRQGDPSQPVTSRTLKTPFVSARQTRRILPDLPDAPDAPDAPTHASARATHAPVDAEPPDQPTIRTPAASQDDAWLRETNAQPTVNTAEPPTPPSAGYTPEWQWSEQQAYRRPSYHERPVHDDRSGSDERSPERFQEYAGWQVESGQPMPTPQVPAPQPAATPFEPPYEPSYEPPTAHHWAASQRWDEQLGAQDDPLYGDPHAVHYQDEAETAVPSDDETPHAPWHEDNWQPPILPRFGPQRDDDPRQR